MKRGLKWLLAAGVTACLLGVGMMTAGAMIGGVDWLLDFPYFRFGKYRINGGAFADRLTTADIQGETIGGANQTVEYTSIRELKIEVVGDSQVQLFELDREELPEDTIRIVHSGSGEILYELNTQGDTLAIDLPGTWKNTRWRSVEDLEIYIPRNYQFREVSIECVAGELDADAVYAQELSLENVSGSVFIGGGRVDTLEVECLSGTTECNALIERKADVECTSGTVDITMADSWQSYDYKWSCLSGTITADGRELDAGYNKGKKKEQNHGTGNKVELECVSGTININYKNES